MQKERMLWAAIIVLLLINMATLVTIFMNGTRQAAKGETRKFDRLVVRTLRLDEEQERKFERMKRAHHSQMISLDESMRAPFESYFSLLLEETPDAAKKDSLEHVLTSIYRHKVAITFAHFAELKSICTPEQQKEFDQLIPSLMQVITPRPPHQREENH